MKIIKILLFMFSLILLTACKTANYGSCEPTDEIPKLVKKAEHGDTVAACRLRWHYEYCEDDQKQALYWLRKGAFYGDAIAQQQLACMLLDKLNEHVTHSDRDINEGIEYLKSAAKQDDIVAQTLLGDYFRDGKHVTKDWKQSEYWYRKMTKVGDTTGMYKLSDLLLENKKSISGLTEAYKWAAIIKYRSTPETHDYQKGMQQQNAVIAEAEKLNINVATLKMKAEAQAEIENKIIPKYIFDSDYTCNRKHDKKKQKTEQ